MKFIVGFRKNSGVLWDSELFDQEPEADAFAIRLQDAGYEVKRETFTPNSVYYPYILSNP